MFAAFRPGASWLHALTPGIKLLALALAGTGLFFVSHPGLMLALLGLVLLLFPAAGLPLRAACEQLRPALVLIALLVAVQALISDLPTAMLVGARLVALILLAGLVTLTTRTSAMIETLEGVLGWLAPLGVNPRKAALALSLGVRFIPLLAGIVDAVREAQRVRGLERDILALAIPTLIRALALTDDVSDAIEARGFDAGQDRP